jgi:uncharacterized protein (DUF58 family)
VKEGKEFQRYFKTMNRAKFTPRKPSSRSTRQVERHLNLRLLPILVVVLAVLYILTGFRGWLVFTIGTAGAWLMALVWIYSMEHNLWIERKIHLAWSTAGESVPEEIRLTNHGWLPALWVEITDESSSIETPLRIVSDVPQRSSRNRHLNHLFKQRGLYTLGPTRLRCGDPLGIYTLTMNDQHSSTILVTPPVLPLSRLKIPTGGISGDERHRGGYIERNISDGGLRNYVPGDSLKHIHWRASAHFDSLIVRQLETATTRDWWIVVDLENTAQAGSGENSTLELCIVLAASLAMRGLKELRKVGLAMAGSQFVWLEPRSDPAQGWRILRSLAVAQAGQQSLSDMLMQGRLGKAAMAILITPSTNTDWVATANRQRNGVGIMSLLVDPVDFGGLVDQSKVISALAHSRIPYVHMPGSLLEEAYTLPAHGTRRQIAAGGMGKRYLQQGRQSWQNMV